MIDKNKLIDALHEACEIDSFKELPTWVIQVINKQPEIERWIPISEPPEIGERVLVLDKYGKVGIDVLLEVSGNILVWDNLRPIAWQPLPDGYEVVSEEK